MGAKTFQQHCFSCMHKIIILLCFLKNPEYCIACYCSVNCVCIYSVALTIIKNFANINAQIQIRSC